MMFEFGVTSRVEDICPIMFLKCVLGHICMTKCHENIVNILIGKDS